MVKDKILLQSRVLESCGQFDAASTLKNYCKEVRSGDSSNREAVAAALYFTALFGEPFNRDLACPLNYSLDYGYSVVLSKVAREIASRGYLTEIGIHHRGKLNPWNLACDFMEPFRPYIDIVISRTDKDCFDVETRRQLTSIMSDFVVYRDGKYKLGSVVSLYVLECLEALGKRRDINDISCYEL